MSKHLQDRDYTLILDRSGSMAQRDMPGGKTRWAEARESTYAVAAKCAEFDPDGITVYLFNSRPKRFDNTTPEKVLQLFDEYEPVGGTNLTGALDDALNSYFQRKAAGQTKPAGEIFVVVTDGEHEIRFPFLRQQIAKREGRANMCLADFIDPAGDWIGGFAVTAGHGIEPHLERYRADNDDYSGILLKALADRFAEAFAERLHKHVRTTLWGYAEGEQLDNEALIREQYRGIRPAPGYPACPDHSKKRMLFDLMGAEAATGIELTDHFAMVPTAAVSGFYIGHAQASYFGVARIGEDQLADYAGRRGVSLDQARRWLRPNLD